jgi:hypothetical protein
MIWVRRGTGKSNLAQAIGLAAIQQGYRDFTWPSMARFGVATEERFIDDHVTVRMPQEPDTSGEAYSEGGSDIPSSFCGIDPRDGYRQL